MIKYTNDKSTQIVLALLKSFGIRKVIASPGTTNIALVASMQYDTWFEMYSAVDERSAAYMACGLSSESGEVVVLTCTEATASRNYYPALTEAYYRKLPILVIAGTHGNDKAGHLHAQSLDRSVSPTDTFRYKTNVFSSKTKDEEWLTIVNTNKALLELSRHGGGPVLINLQEATGAGFSTTSLPPIRKICRVLSQDIFPSIKNNSKVVIFIGSHKTFSSQETSLIERFCEQYNGVVFCDLTSNYHGKYRVFNSLLGCQENQCQMQQPDLIIHLGEVSGEIYNTYHLFARQTWRVNEDGEVRDLFRNLTYIFEMSEMSFFSYYTKSSESNKITTDFCEYFLHEYNQLYSSIPELPFSNIWIAKQLFQFIPKESYLHTSIFNSLRSWNFFLIPDSITTHCNVGGFGIDGALSTLIGSSLANPQKLHFGIFGDLAFFYDMNVLGNRHVGKNVRILLINNGKGTEFRNYDHPASQFGDDADRYIAAGGHFSMQFPFLVKAYVEALGFKYLRASNKESFINAIDIFMDPVISESPLLFEVFTSSQDESEAIRLVRNIVKDERTFTERLHDKAKSLAHRLTK